jgi:hypothetical protein
MLLFPNLQVTLFAEINTLRIKFYSDCLFIAKLSLTLQLQDTDQCHFQLP